MLPSIVIAPVIVPRTTAEPRPVSSPVSEPASDQPMLMPAPSATPRPTTRAVCEFEVIAAAKIGAIEEIVPSIRPTSPGCTTRSRKSRSSRKPARWIQRDRGLSSRAATVFASCAHGGSVGERGA